MNVPALAVIISKYCYTAATFDVEPLSIDDFAHILRGIVQKYVMDIFQYMRIPKKGISNSALLSVEQNYALSDALNNVHICVIINGEVFNAEDVYFNDLFHDIEILLNSENEIDMVDESVCATLCRIEDPGTLLEYLNT